jgi:hypothetical protein
MQALAPWLLEQEARALLTRLRRVRPLALQETMVPAAGIAPAAQVEIERFLVAGRGELQQIVDAYIAWLRGRGSTASPAAMQRMFALVRLRFNEVLDQFDLFADVLTMRSESEIGVFLAGLDALAADGLAIPETEIALPETICYLDRGPGAAIRRARTRLPGGGSVGVAIVRVPRERMVGFGLASSILHEVGHQAVALLDLAASLRPQLQGFQRSGSAHDRAAWARWDRTLNECLADFWAVGRLGIAATLGLMAVISLPPYFVWTQSPSDPHPLPALRLKVSAALGEALYPNRQWKHLTDLWAELYPPPRLPRRERGTIAALEATLPAFVATIVDHRPRSLRGRSLREVMPLAERTPEQLLNLYRVWLRRPALMRVAAPSLSLAVFGQARAAGALSPEAESHMLRSLLTHWALQRTVRLASQSARALARKPERPTHHLRAVAVAG